MSFGPEFARLPLAFSSRDSAALHASETDGAKLTAALEANGRAPDQKAFEQTDLMFHYTLAMISHNPIFTSLNHALNEWLAEQRSVSAHAGASHHAVYLEHKAVHDAILRHDAAAAEAAMEAHLAGVYRNYWTAVQPAVVDAV